MARIQHKRGRKGAKQRRGGRKMVNVNRALGPLAQRYITSMKYTETFTLSSLVNAYRFRMNGGYDPNYTGGGHQPYGWDQLSAIYNRYRVISCAWTINAVNTNSEAFRITALPSNDVVSPTDPSNSMENPRCRWMVQFPYAPSKTLKGKIYLPSLVGRNKAQYLADDRYQALTTSVPDEAALLNIFLGAMDDASYPAGSTKCVINLTYKVEFFDLKNLAQS